MIPIKGTIKFNTTRDNYHGKAIIGRSWVLLKDRKQMIPRDQVGEIEIITPRDVIEEKLDKMKNC